jgi:hypothetical protein
MKLIGIDIDGKEQNYDFFNQVEKLLDIEILRLPLEDIKKNTGTIHKYDNFARASFALDKFTIDDIDYYSNNKPFINAIFAWGDYSLDNIEHLKIYNDAFFKDLLVFQNAHKNKEPQWAFGNIIAMTKWSASLFKIKTEWFDENGRDSLMNKTKMGEAIWYASRMGLDVRGFK